MGASQTVRAGVACRSTTDRHRHHKIARQDTHMKAEYDSTPKYFRYAARLLRPFPDVDFSFIKPIRKRAADLLRLTQGNRVLDVGCGPGGSFPFLLERVGDSGQVIGVEISDEVAANARNRIAKNGWHNAEVITAPARV